MNISSRRWGTVYTVLCFWVASTKAYTVFVYTPQSQIPTVTDTKQSYVEFEDLTRENDYQSRLIPIKAPRVDKHLTTLSLEPEAEMLPAHYTGVKPPGVDHMELRYAESQVSEVNPRHQSLRGSNQHGASRQTSGSSHDVQRQKLATLEKGQKGDHQKEKQKSQYIESGGKKKSHSEKDADSGHEETRAGGKAGNSHQKKKNDYLDSKVGGYRNVYHKDEFKRDHDFYDNDDEGGHLKKHGRYKENHVAAEGTYKKGASRNAGSDEAETGKKGAAKNSRAEQESKGHVAGRGYDGFFKNFQGFAKQASQAENGKFGFAEAKGR
ncbi:uncharacterized protein LOC143218668 [Lasioglossum baleicum]|uniref:uncharacterized protein LOC143218668 n=1 Tax=Lasioglossum baleicum TaxID=434251 RepID=UPI003FCEBCA8